MAKKRWNLTIGEDEVALARQNAALAGLNISQYLERLIRRDALTRKLDDLVADETVRAVLQRELESML